MIPHIQELHDAMMDFRSRYSFGNAIALPQLGEKKRIIYWNVEKPVVMINPILSNKSEEMFELWDNCMSFPTLMVRILRHKSCTLTFRDLDWKKHIWYLEDELSELIQHENDHLDGILAVQRAIDDKSFKMVWTGD